jgi:hypothetical protein
MRKVVPYSILYRAIFLLKFLEKEMTIFDHFQFAWIEKPLDK